MLVERAIQFVIAICVTAAFSQYIPTKADSGWRPLFNGNDLKGLFPHIDGYAFGVTPPQGFIEIEEGVITFYPGFTYGNGDPSNNGYLSTGTEYSYYRCRVEYRHGDYTNRSNSGWLSGDPFNSGFFYHVKPGAAVWPPTIEYQLKRHWNSNAPNGGTVCTAGDGDCNQVWAGDFWILGGAQIRNRFGQLTALGGCCNPALVDRNEFPDYELEGWNQAEIEVYGDSAFSNFLNGYRVNWGTEATYQDESGQRVPLTEGAIALELEGSEIQFRNWEILLFEADPLYDSMYTPGCLDSSYEEYMEEADLHMAELCQTPVVSVRGSGYGMEEPFHYNPVNQILSFHHHKLYRYVFRNVEGEFVLEGRRLGAGDLSLNRELTPGIYLMRVESDGSNWSKRILAF